MSTPSVARTSRLTYLLAEMTDADGLNPRQRRFVNAYLVDPHAARSAITAGYSPKTADVIGRRLLRNVSVCSVLTREQKVVAEKALVTAEQVVRELARIGFSDMRAFTEWGDGGVTLLDSAALSEDAARCVSEVSQTITKEGGSIRFKLHDKPGALALIGKHLNMFPTNIDMTSKGEKLAVVVQIVREGRKVSAG